MAKALFEPIFLKHAKIAFDAATALQGLAAETHRMGDFLERITLLEKDADRCAAEAYELMDNSFIPRYDKPDIADVVAHLDDFVDGVYDTAVFFRDYDLKVVEREAVALIGLLPELANIMIRAIEQMPKLGLKDALSARDQIKTLERAADKLRSEGRSRAHKEFSATDFIVWNEINRKLEHTADHGLDLMNALVSIVRKENH